MLRILFKYHFFKLMCEGFSQCLKLFYLSMEAYNIYYSNYSIFFMNAKLNEIKCLFLILINCINF